MVQVCPLTHFKLVSRLACCRELLRLAAAINDRKAGRGPRGGYSPLQREYMSLLESRLDAGDPVFEAVSDVMLFTYTDRDGYTPPSEIHRSLLVVPDEAAAAAAVAAAAASSGPAGGSGDASASGVASGAAGGVAGGSSSDASAARAAASSGATAGLGLASPAGTAGAGGMSPLAAAVASPLSDPRSAAASAFRERPFSVMYVMAAVSVAREGYRARRLDTRMYEVPLLMIRHHAPPTGQPTAHGGPGGPGAGGPGAAARRADAPVSTLLEMRPGFAEPLPLGAGLLRAAAAAGLTANSTLGPGRYGGELKLRALTLPPAVADYASSAAAPEGMGGLGGTLSPSNTTGGALGATVGLTTVSRVGALRAAAAAAGAGAGAGMTLGSTVGRAGAGSVAGDSMTGEGSGGLSLSATTAAAAASAAHASVGALVEVHSFRTPDGASFEYTVINPSEDAATALLAAQAAAATGDAVLALTAQLSSPLAAQELLRSAAAAASEGMAGAGRGIGGVAGLLPLAPGDAAAALAAATGDPLAAALASEQRALAAASHRVGSDFRSAIPRSLKVHPRGFRLTCFLEIVAAARFADADALFIAFELVLPAGGGWTVLADGSGRPLQRVVGGAGGSDAPLLLSDIAGGKDGSGAGGSGSGAGSGSGLAEGEYAAAALQQRQFAALRRYRRGEARARRRLRGGQAARAGGGASLGDGGADADADALLALEGGEEAAAAEEATFLLSDYGRSGPKAGYAHMPAPAVGGSDGGRDRDRDAPGLRRRRRGGSVSGGDTGGDRGGANASGIAGRAGDAASSAAAGSADRGELGSSGSSIVDSSEDEDDDDLYDEGNDDIAGGAGASSSDPVTDALVAAALKDAAGAEDAAGGDADADYGASTSVSTSAIRTGRRFPVATAIAGVTQVARCARKRWAFAGMEGASGSGAAAAAGGRPGMGCCADPAAPGSGAAGGSLGGASGSSARFVEETHGGSGVSYASLQHSRGAVAARLAAQRQTAEAAAAARAARLTGTLASAGPASPKREAVGFSAGSSGGGTTGAGGTGATAAPAFGAAAVLLTGGSSGPLASTAVTRGPPPEIATAGIARAAAAAAGAAGDGSDLGSGSGGAFGAPSRGVMSGAGSVSLVTTSSFDGLTDALTEDANTLARSSGALGSGLGMRVAGSGSGGAAGSTLGDAIGWFDPGGWGGGGPGSGSGIAGAAASSALALLDTERVPVAHICHPLDIHLLYEPPQSTAPRHLAAGSSGTGAAGAGAGTGSGSTSSRAPPSAAYMATGGLGTLKPPTLYFTVMSKDRWERQSVHGYGALTLPLGPGIANHRVRTWVPSAPLRDQEYAYYLGGVGGLTDITYVTVPESEAPSIAAPRRGGSGSDAAALTIPSAAAAVQRAEVTLSKLGMSTVTAGDIAVRTHTLLVRPPPQASALTAARAVAVQEAQAAKAKSVSDIISQARTLRARLTAGDMDSGASTPVSTFG